MKILIVNYRYFISGGPERYMFNIKKLLEDMGHEVIPFSIHSNKNVDTEYSKYFVEPIGGRDSVYFEEVKKTPKSIWKLISRSIYSLEVKKAIQNEIDEQKPDLVYIIHFVNKLSPSVIKGAKERGIPVVLRLSDYFLLCPRFDFLYNGKICEDCVKKGYSNCIKNKCVKNSLFASVVRVLSMKIHKIIKIYDDVDAFITPSQFLKNKLIENGFDEKRIHCIPTFTRGESEEYTYKIGDYGLYFGRIAVEKGVETVVKAYEQLVDKELVIMGDDTTEEALRLKEYVSRNNLDNIHFIGLKKGKELEEVIDNSRFVIIPSIWYDNLPNTALEAFAHYKPVIVSNIGSLPELVEDGYNGYLFDAGNYEDLIFKVKLLDDDNVVKEFSKGAKDLLSHKFSITRHYNKLVSVFDCVRKNYE